MLASFYRPAGRRVKILIEAGAFSSDRHAVASQLAWHGLDAQTSLIELGPHARPGPRHAGGRSRPACEQVGDEIALVLWPGVQFRTGQSFDLARIARAAHGVPAAWWVSISRTPSATRRSHCTTHDADFAVWCGYKYLNGGPGRDRRLFRARAPLAHARRGSSGWWGHELPTRFQMEPEFRAATGRRRLGGEQSAHPVRRAAAGLACDLPRGGLRAAAREVPARSPDFWSSCSSGSAPRGQDHQPARRPRSAAASSRCASRGPRPRQTHLRLAGRARRRLRLARAGRHPRSRPCRSTTRSPTSSVRRGAAARAGRSSLKPQRDQPRQHRRRRPRRGAARRPAGAARLRAYAVRAPRRTRAAASPSADARSTSHLAARGIRALERAGLMDAVRPLLIPMRGRMVHDRHGGTALHPYGQRDDEVIYSVGRARAQPAAHRGSRATARGDAALRAERAWERTRRATSCASADGVEQAEYEIPLAPTIATDGAGSPVRSSLAFGAHVAVREEFLDHDYKELTIPRGERPAGAGSERPARVAARWLHAHRAAEHRWQLHCHAVPGTQRREQLRLTDGVRRREGILPARVPGCAGADAEPADASSSTHPQGQLGTVHTAPFTRAAGCCWWAMPRTQSSLSTARE